MDETTAPPAPPAAGLTAASRECILYGGLYSCEPAYALRWFTEGGPQAEQELSEMRKGLAALDAVPPAAPAQPDGR